MRPNRFWCELTGSDKARISRPIGGGTMFLIIGYKRNTLDTPGFIWTRGDGTRIDFEYTEEHCVASGRTVLELIASAKKYVRMKGKTMKEFMDEGGTF